MFNAKIIDVSRISSTTDTDCLVLGIYENGILSQIAQKLVQKNELIDAYKTGDINGKVGSALLLRQPRDSKIKRILLVGLGKNQKITEKDFFIVCKTIVTKFFSISVKDVVLVLPFNQIQNKDIAWAIKKYIGISYEQSYKSDALKSKKETKNEENPQTVTFAVAKNYFLRARQAITQGKAIAESIKFTKDIANLPGNICTPTFLAKTAQNLAVENDKLNVSVLEEKQIAALKMGSFLSVSRGSEEPPKFIVLKYQGTSAKRSPIVLVGKGLTFDSGGISLKPGAKMDEMKYDMCGAASVLGAIKTVCALNLKLNVIGLIPSCENLPSGRANKPGDIVTSMSGTTIEILNTDAEGRLILCDALTYAERFNPSLVIDIATLTGACIVALGNHNSGLFTRHDPEHDKLANALIRAGKNSGDTVWRLPIEDAYQEQLKSNFADVANVGGSFGGSITAACFLERFARKYTWAHLDIAGTAWKSGAAKGATGRPVPLLTEFLIEQSIK